MVIKEKCDGLAQDVATELLKRISDGTINEELSVLTLSSENM